MKGKALFAALAPLGFENSGDICYGTWKGYPVALRKEAIISTRYIVRVAARLENLTGTLRKALRRAVNTSNLLRGAFDVDLITREEVICSLSFTRADDPAALFTNHMDTLISALRENNIAPGEKSDILQIEEQIEVNEGSGSARSGKIGAVLGMVVGLVPTLLALYIGWVFPPAFLLIPLATFFGYKLFRGKMNTAAIKVVTGVSLIGVILLPLYVELVSFFVHGEWMTPGDALLLNVKSFLSSEDFSTSTLVIRLLISLVFFGTGIGITWREIKRGMKRNVKE